MMLPRRDPERLARLEERRGGRTGRIPWTITNGTYLAWQDGPATLEAQPFRSSDFHRGSSGDHIGGPDWRALPRRDALRESTP
jgi:hypothetical protein